ncbi:MAG: PAS domain S-box protein, partial [Pseudomonadota bacterium]
MSKEPTYKELEKKVHELEQAVSKQDFSLKEQLMISEVLQLINDTDTLKDLLESIIPCIKKWSGCEAVGIRLKEGPDFPYRVTTGFSEQFVRLERHLCSYSKDGEVMRDDEGNPELACMCGNIICGRFDPSKNFFSPDGSFWSNCTTRLLATTTDAERQARTRNRCNSVGYESVALIPLRSAGTTFGLLQLNDHQQGKFSAELIALYRRIADYIAVYLARRQALEELEKKEIQLRTLINALPDLVWLKDPDGVYLLCNKRFEGFFGSTEAQIIGKTDYDFLEKELADFFRDKDRKVIAAGKPCANEEEIVFADDGHHEFLETIKTPMLDQKKRVVGVLGIGRDITSRVQIETILKKSENQLRLFIRHTPAAIAMFDLQMRYIEASNRWLSDYSLENREIIGQSHYEILPEIPYEWKESHRKGMNGEVTKVEEECFTRLDGSRQWLKREVRPWYKTDDEVGGIIILTEDISKQKKIQKELKESEARFKFLSEATFEGIQIHDEGIILDANQSFAKMLGYDSAEEIIGQNIMPRHLTPESFEIARSKIASGYQGAYEVVGIRCDGTQLPVEIVSKNIEYIGKKVRVTAARDITERKYAEQRLKWNVERNKLLSETAALLLQSNDPRNLIKDLCTKVMLFLECQIFFNFLKDPKLGKLHLNACSDIPEEKYPEIEWIEFGSTVCGTVAQTQKPMFYANISDSQDPKTELQKSFGIRSYYCHPLMFENLTLGTLSFGRSSDPQFNLEEIEVMKAVANQVAIAVNRIETENTKIDLENQLHQAQKMESIGRLAGGVAHDYNNMLSVIIGYTEMALGEIDFNNQLHKDLSEVLTAAKRSTEITQQLLAFARKQTIAPKVVELNSTVENMLKMLRRLIGEDIDLRWLPGAEVWSIRIDPSQVNQILANLCVNARDAITNVGKVTIETKNVRFDEAYCADHKGFIAGEYVMLAVSDDGSGIPPKILDKIFEPFFTTKELGRGTGLGLSTIYGIVKQNNGFINVYSEPEKGTTFRIYLSRYSGDIKASKAEDVSDIPLSRGESILLVEDDASILKLGVRILKDLGYTVISAASPT